MKKWVKFLLRLVGTTVGVLLMYIYGWPNYMTICEYLLMSFGIGLFISGLITYGDDISKIVEKWIRRR